jgi:hypothetical protein
LKGENSVIAISVTTSKQYLITKNWDTVRKLIGNDLFQHLYENYLIFVKSRDCSLVQVTGKNIFSYLKFKTRNEEEKERVKSDCDKYNIRNQTDSYKNNTSKSYWDDQISRTRIFYCTQLNRKNAFFKKNEIVRLRKN